MAPMPAPPAPSSRNAMCRCSYSSTERSHPCCLALASSAFCFAASTFASESLLASWGSPRFVLLCSGTILWCGCSLCSSEAMMAGPRVLGGRSICLYGMMGPVPFLRFHVSFRSHLRARVGGSFQVWVEAVKLFGAVDKRTKAQGPHRSCHPPHSFVGLFSAYAVPAVAPTNAAPNPQLPAHFLSRQPMQGISLKCTLFSRPSGSTIRSSTVLAYTSGTP